MNRLIKYLVGTVAITIVVLSNTGCKNDDPSVLKIFARSASNALLESAEVVIIGDPSSNPATMPYVDTLLTNASGYATFNMDDYFDKAGSGNTVGYFDVRVSKDGKFGTSYVRCRQHITTVETVYLSN